MTRDEILAMVPGRELDAEVALRVFKVKEITMVGNYWFIDPLDSKLPQFSTSIRDAWKVLDKMQDEWSWEISCYTTSHETDVRIGKGLYTSKSVPEAICKAALLAVINL